MEMRGHVHKRAHLKPRYQTRDEDHGGDNDSSGRIFVLHAESRSEDEGNRHDSSNHGHVVLHCEKYAQIPWWSIVYSICYIHPFFPTILSRISRRFLSSTNCYGHWDLEMGFSEKYWEIGTSRDLKALNPEFRREK